MLDIDLMTAFHLLNLTLFGYTLLLLRMENKCRKCPQNKSQNLYQFFSTFAIIPSLRLASILLRLRFNIEIEFHRNQEEEIEGEGGKC